MPKLGKCDHCGVEGAEVVAFELLLLDYDALGRRGNGSGPIIDLCDGCEAWFLAAVEPFIGEDDARDLRRAPDGS